MNQSKAKRIRRHFREEGTPICGEPYSVTNRQEIITSPGRRQYQAFKKAVKEGRKKI